MSKIRVFITDTDGKQLTSYEMEFTEIRPFLQLIQEFGYENPDGLHLYYEAVMRSWGFYIGVSKGD